MLTCRRKGPFTHRDAAHEGKFARNQEAEQLRALRQRLSEQRGRIDELENYMYVAPTLEDEGLLANESMVRSQSRIR